MMPPGVCGPGAGAVLFIVGMTRGGNTWLGKIFDAHPDVFYRHEPDSIVRTRAVPAFCPPDAVERFLEPAREHFERAIRVRTSKAVGSFPVMRKAYYGPLRFRAKQAMVVGAKGFEKIGLARRFFRNLPLPDLTCVDDARVRLVVKSIAALGQMNLFVRLYPAARIVLLLRHPCGQVQSALAAIRAEKIDGQVPATVDWGIYEDMAGTPQAWREGLDMPAFRAMDPVERLAWRWAIFNDKALADLDGAPNVRVTRYEDLCADPIAVGRDLFAFAGLNWHPAVERFALASSGATGSNTYDRVFRDSLKTANAWRTKLDAGQIAMIERIAARSRAGAYYGPA